MENRKPVIFLTSFLFLLGFFIVGISDAFAYEVETHAFLTDEIVKFYNQHFQINKDLLNFRDYLIDGSRREDDPPRWFNHFYDPVYNRGLSYDPVIDSLYVGNWQKSKDWATDSENQNKWTYSPAIATILSSVQSWKIQKYFPTSDFTWNEAIRYWLSGEKEISMFALGHILHLIEDETVPDHTRNDPHPGDSPYELYTHRFTLSEPDISISERLRNKLPFVLYDLNSYFDELANYSNNNFCSKDTIGIQAGYKIPEPSSAPIKINGGFFAYNSFEDDNRPLFFYKKYNSGIFSMKTEIDLNDPQNYVVGDYWSRLSTKAVQYGAGVINLFFQEVEKYKNDLAFATKEDKSFWSQAVDVVTGLADQATNTIVGSLPIPDLSNFNSAPFEQAIADNIQKNADEIPLIASQTDTNNVIQQNSITESQSQPEQLQESAVSEIVNNSFNNQTNIETAPTTQTLSQVSSQLPPVANGPGNSVWLASGGSAGASENQAQNNPPVPLPEIPDFNISYTTSTPQIFNFSWGAPSINSSSTINYILTDVTDINSPIIIIQTLLTFATSTIQEVDKTYNFKLKAVDQNDVALAQEASKEITVPPHQPPQFSENLSVNFDNNNSKITVSWPNTATDPDTALSDLIYQINFSPINAFDDVNWVDAVGTSYEKSVIPGDNFLISVRVRDEFNNFSSNSFTEWTYPTSGYFIEQTSASTWMYAPLKVGYRNQNCNTSDGAGGYIWCPQTAGLQSFIPVVDLTINRIALKIRRTQGGYGGSPTLFIYPDNGNNFPDFNSVIAQASLGGLTTINADKADPTNAEESIFSYNLVNLTANTKYWLDLAFSYDDSRGVSQGYDWKVAADTINNLYLNGASGHGHHGSCSGFPSTYCYFTIPYSNANTDWYFRIGLQQL